MTSVKESSIWSGLGWVESPGYQRHSCCTCPTKGKTLRPLVNVDVVVEVRGAGEGVEVVDDALVEAQEAAAEAVVAPVAVAHPEVPLAVGAVVGRVAVTTRRGPTAQVSG